MLLPDVTYQILGWTLVAFAALTPVLVVIFSIRNYRLRAQDFETIRFKAAAAICIWLFLTLGMFLLLAFLAYVIGEAMSLDPSAKPHPTLTYVAIHLIYFAVCYLLVDWVSRRKHAQPNHSVSSGAT